MRAQIGPYRIEGALAEGGMGRVYKGRHVTLGRDVALKTPLPEKPGAALRERLLAEAQALALLKHQGIVTVYDAFIDPETEELFVAMEYVEGMTLATLLDSRPGGRMTLVEALPLFRQILEALEYVHSQQIIHRDVKPSNVMVCGPAVKVMDFGLAIVAGASRLTVSRKILGSLPYMSPEQLEAKATLDRRTDIYSAALVLYRMLSGIQPFDGGDLLAQVNARRVGPADLRTLVPDLPSGVCDAVMLALHVDPTRRFPSAARFRDALLDGEAGLIDVLPQQVDDTVPQVVPDAPTEPLPLPERRTPATATLAWAAVAVCLAAVMYGIVLLANRKLPLPVTPPGQNQARSVSPAVPATVTIVMPTQPPSPSEEDRQAKVEAAARREAERRRELEQQRQLEQQRELARLRELERQQTIAGLREDITTCLKRAAADLRNDSFESAHDQLRLATDYARTYPADFEAELARIADLRAEIIAAQQAAQMWRSRLADIDDDLHGERWPEAERFAQNILDNAKAPEPIRTRAAALLQRAKDGRVASFKETQVGKTKNTIVRKPSSPPRRDR